ncbi:MAG TPA: clostripain-related cysteine peptidase [Candidatus Limiplasma sp.]|nr:clostripain-related cysteine peptidase [Candidatus Limiplasma sp.]HRX07655.1 clostripain-related cysteine peptidase [Candidatus Limiplasma sp.]
MKKRWIWLLLLVLILVLCVSAAAQDQAEWTVLWYLCGTDLETEDGAATYNLQEAIAGMGTEDVNVIVITGGTKEWQNNIVPNDAIGLFRLNGDGLIEIGRLEDRNMADEDLLSSMIQEVFGMYPAKHTMLLLWDHGGGSVGGVAFDERTDDSISLTELQTALSQGGQIFDIIGFDACLMATLESANALAPYGRYMVASQELEPGGGWNYREIMKAFTQNPAIAPDVLGKSICDSYLQHCIAWDDKEIATLSLVNLEKIPALVDAFDAMAWQLTAVVENPAAIQTYRQEVGKARSFGGNNKSEGYTHMVDLGELVLNTQGVWDSVGLTVLDRLFEAVEYAIDGSTRQKSSGLSVFYPFTTDSEVRNACAVIAEVPVSKAYMRFVGAMVPAWSVPADMNQTLGDRPEDSYTAQETTASAAVDTAAETTVAQLNPTEYQVSFSTEIDADGYYTLYVDQGLDIVEDVQFALYLIDSEENVAVFLGSDNDIDAYWDDGVFYDNFRGVWLTINGEYCSPILIDSQEDYNLYTIPIELNGQRTNLRVMYVIESVDEDGITGSYQVIGVWDGTDEQTGITARDIRPLQEGDIILPLFDAYSLSDTDSMAEEWTSYEVTAGANGEIVLDELDLFDGEYYYTFLLTDIFGQSYESDGVFLYIDGGEFYFE